MPCTSCETNGRKMSSRVSIGTPGPLSSTSTSARPRSARTETSTAPPRRRPAQRVRDQVADDLQQAVAVAEHQYRPAERLRSAARRTPCGHRRRARGSRARRARRGRRARGSARSGAPRASRGRAGRRSAAAGDRPRRARRRATPAARRDRRAAPSAISCTWPWIAVSGVRSSCEIRIRKLRSCSSDSRSLRAIRSKPRREQAELVPALAAQLDVVEAERDLLARLRQLAHGPRQAPREEDRPAARSRSARPRPPAAAPRERERRRGQLVVRPREHDRADRRPGSAPFSSWKGAATARKVCELSGAGVERLRRALRGELVPVDQPTRRRRAAASVDLVGRRSAGSGAYEELGRRRRAFSGGRKNVALAEGAEVVLLALGEELGDRVACVRSVRSLARAGRARSDAPRPRRRAPPRRRRCRRRGGGAGL